MRNHWLQRIGIIITTAVMLVFNILATFFPFTGKTTGQIANQYPVYFIPAGYVFLIWNIIYIGLIAFTIYQALPKQQSNKLLPSIRGWYLLSCVANSAWLMLWQYEQIYWSVVAMLILLISLIMIYRLLNQFKRVMTAKEFWPLQAPFSLYLGWITVATFANITVALYVMGWDGWHISAQLWSVIMMMVATFIALMITIPHKDIVYGLVIIWALVGIAVKFLTISIIVNTALGLAFIQAVAIMGMLLHHSRIEQKVP